MGLSQVRFCICDSPGFISKDSLKPHVKKELSVGTIKFCLYEHSLITIRIHETFRTNHAV